MNYFEISWDDGSGDKFYLDFSKLTQDNPLILVTSDENNTSIERTKILRFRGSVTPNYPQADTILKVTQQVDNLVLATFENQASIYQNTKAGYLK